MIVSDTPRTDDAQWGTGKVTTDFARALERELSKESARLRWVLENAEVAHLTNPSIPLDTISAIDKAMGNP